MLTVNLIGITSELREVTGLNVEDVVQIYFVPKKARVRIIRLNNL